MSSWWSFAENNGYRGKALALHRITCPFCEERGNFSTEYHAEKKKPNGRKILNFDTLQCGRCASYVQVFWSAAEDGSGIHNYKVQPWSLKLDHYPKHWPEDVGRCWLQGKRNLKDGNWDAAALMARSALQLALREQGAQGDNLKQEIKDLVDRSLLTKIIGEWSENVRTLGNNSAHPMPGQAATNAQDAKDIVQFLDFLLEYLYTLPKKINDYRERDLRRSKTPTDQGVVKNQPTQQSAPNSRA